MYSWQQAMNSTYLQESYSDLPPFLAHVQLWIFSSCFWPRYSLDPLDKPFLMSCTE